MCDVRTLNAAGRDPAEVRGPGAPPSLSLALYCPAWPPGDGSNGVVTYVGTIVPALQAQGHAVSVISSSVARAAPAEGIYGFDDYLASRTLPGRILDRLMRLRGHEHAFNRMACRAIATAARRAVAERGVQILEMEETFGWPLGVRRRIPIPIVVRLHGPWFLNGPANGQLADPALDARVRREGLALRVADGITAPSLDVLERARAYYGLALEHAEVIPNPVPDAPPAVHWDAAGADPETILFIGRFDLHKGGDLIIDAFRRVMQRTPRARLRFVGPDRGIRGGDRGWTIRDYAEDRIPGAWQSGRFEWLGPQPHSALAGLRRTAALTVVCSRYETFGLTAAEAMSQGCPLVVSAAGALPEIVQDGVNGLVCRPGDPADLAEKVCLLLEHPDYAARLAHQALIDSRRYNPGALAARSIDYYHGVIARARTRSRTPLTEIWHSSSPLC